MPSVFSMAGSFGYHPCVQKRDAQHEFLQHEGAHAELCVEIVNTLPREPIEVIHNREVKIAARQF